MNDRPRRPLMGPVPSISSWRRACAAISSAVSSGGMGRPGTPRRRGRRSQRARPITEEVLQRQPRHLPEPRLGRVWPKHRLVEAAHEARVARVGRVDGAAPLGEAVRRGPHDGTEEGVGVAAGVDDLIDALDGPGAVRGRARVEAAVAVRERRVPIAGVLRRQLRCRVRRPAVVVLEARLSRHAAKMGVQVRVPHRRVARRITRGQWCPLSSEQ